MCLLIFNFNFFVGVCVYIPPYFFVYEMCVCAAFVYKLPTFSMMSAEYAEDKLASW